MAAASALAGDRGDVEVCLGRPQADPVRRPVRGGRLADQRCELGPLDRAQVVDDPLGIRFLRARVLEVLALEVGDDHAPSLEDLGVLERARDELELREGDVLVHALEDAVDVGPRLHELGGETKCLGRRVRVLEATGVGDDGDVERLGDLRGEADAELAEDVGEDLAGRGGVADDQIHLPEAGVVVVVVDVHDELCLFEQRRLGAEPPLVRAVQCDNDPLRGVRVRAAQDPGEVHELVLVRDRHLAEEVHVRVLAQLAQCKRHGEKRAEGVAVGILVGRDDEAVVAPESLCDRSKVCLSWCSSALSSSMSRERRTPLSTVGSYSNVNCGVRFRWSSRFTRLWRTPCEDCRPARVASRFFLDPSTLT